MKLGLEKTFRNTHDNRVQVYVIDNTGTCLTVKTYSTLKAAEKFADKFIAHQIYSNGGEA